MFRSHSLVLMRYWLVRPGWSTSWTALANMADRVSRGVNTDWTRDTVLIIIIEGL